MAELDDYRGVDRLCYCFSFGHCALAVLSMLLAGLLITMGIGSSFSTIPIIAAIYVPLAL
ncbi:MAG: putative histidine transporter YuiF (NhaC family) [Halopseudomonas sp.]|jgi:predicted histidine transporter YuiF (NhaC family)